MANEPNLEVTIGRMKMSNPVMTASGTFGYGEEFAQYFDLAKLGAVVVKGTSVEPVEGNPPPRIAETASGMLNAIGLQNVGLKKLIDEKIPFLSSFNVPIIVNLFFRKNPEELVQLADGLGRAKAVSALELNISCPNYPEGKIGRDLVGQDPEATFRTVKLLREATDLTLIVKLTPNVADIVEIALAAQEAGADALSLINTLVGMAIDVRTRRPKLANVTGGLSGPAIRPVALRMVWQVAKAVNVPVIGMGGICSADDALEFIIAGATAVAVGTANFVNPRTCLEVIDGIRDYMVQEGIGGISELIGSLEV